MRQRLLTGTIGSLVLCLVILGIPLVVLARHEVWTSARDGLNEQAAAAAVEVEDQLERRRTLHLGPLLKVLPNRQITILAPTGRILTAAGPTQHDPFTTEATATDYTVVLAAPKGPVAARADEVTAILIGIAAAAFAAAVALALWQSRRLSAPVARLLARADDLGRGDFTAPTFLSGVPEIDAVAQALDRSARRIGTLVERQRDFATDAAHQLRTPLTSVALHLDEIAAVGGPAVATEAEEALAQVERLARVITAFLARARGDAAPPDDVNLSSLVEDVCSPYARLLRRDARRLHTRISSGVWVSAHSEHLNAALSSLLDNSLVHGSGTVTVTVRGDEDSATIVVTDEGSGVPAELADEVFQRRISGGASSGLGLELARSLTTTEHGTLRLEPPATFVITLPRLERDDA